MKNISDERRANISKGQKARFERPEERAKTAEGTRKVFQDPEQRKKYCIPVLLVETGQVFESALEAQKQTGCARSTICNCCKNNKLWRGLHWVYADPNTTGRCRKVSAQEDL